MRGGWRRSLLIVGLIGWAVLAWSAQAQSDLPPTPLTWDDAPKTAVLRHNGDAQVRLGRFSAADALGPFVTAPFEVGDQTAFNILDPADPQTFELYYRGEYAYFWFAVDSDVDFATLEIAAQRFDAEIWPINRGLFGDTVLLGVDGDPRIHLVHLESLYPGLAGFFSPDDQCAQAICPRSNQRDVLYLMLDYGPLGSDLYFSTITHEYQHMLQFDIDGNEYRWLDEGYSQLAEHIQGFNTDPINLNNIGRYLQNPNIALNSWATDYDAQSIHYGAGYLMAVYLYERFGPDFMVALTHHPADGLVGIDRTLQATGSPLRVDDVVLDWWAANYLNDPAFSDGHYGYTTLEIPYRIVPQPLSINIAQDRLLQSYGVDYWRVENAGDYQLNFSANTTTELIRQTAPHSGSAAWWSNNATATATSLTRTVDLTPVENATLKYWLVGETGNFSGHLQVLASRDGILWEVLRGNHMESFSRFAATLGPHYTTTDRIWMADFVDLSSYAGSIVYVRFEYVTNNAIAGPGFMLDDFAIPEIGWSDDAEQGAHDWEVQGFIRTDGRVQQNWALAVLDPTAATPVQIIPVQDGTAHATITVPTSGATILVGSLAPFTQLPSTYRLELTPP